jgi:DNA-directed RNA polymerase specialized sigma24 family protein
MQDRAERNDWCPPHAPREAEFPVWLAAREGSLHGTAHLLTGDVRAAHDLVLDTAAKLYLAWDRIDDPGAVDAHATRILANEHRLSRFRPSRRRGAFAGTDVSSTSAEYDGRREAVRQLVGLLPGSQRADVVLRFIEQLSPADLDTLRERVVESDYPPIGMPAVVARARVLVTHRRRRAACATALAAVVAGSGALWLASSSRSAPTPDRAGGQSAAVALGQQWRAVAPGTAPRIPYLQGSLYHAADGTVTRLPFREYGLQAAAYRSGFLVVHTGRHGSRLTRLDDRLRPVWSSCASGAQSLVTSPDGTWVAFETRDCRTQVSTLHLAAASGERDLVRVHRVPGRHRVSLTGATETTVGYAYWPPRRGASGPAFVTDFGGRTLEVPTRTPGFALDPSGNGLAAGIDAGSSFAVVDVRSGRVRWRSATPIIAFSHDGSYCVAESPGSRLLHLLDAGDGRQLRTLVLPTGLFQVSGLAWDEDDSVLVVVSDEDAGGSHTAILRFDLQGGPPTLATRVVRNDGPGTGYTFAASAD